MGTAYSYHRLSRCETQPQSENTYAPNSSKPPDKASAISTLGFISASKKTMRSGKKQKVLQPSPTLDDLVKWVAGKSGIVPSHLAPLQQVAQDYNCIIGIRPVEKIATELIEHGYPTKNLHIKGKSATWGPQAGLICFDQRYSKIENQPEQIKKLNQQTQQCITDNYARSVPLAISLARLTNLQKEGYIHTLSNAHARGSITFKAKGPSGKEYSFEAICKPNHSEGVYQITHQDEPIMVLAPPADTKPFTADYDLLLLGPHLSDLGPQDNLQVPDVAHRQKYRALPNSDATNDLWDINNFCRKTDSETGNTSRRIKEMIPIINHYLVGDGNPVMHHSADSSNPAADPTTNYPATFALPMKLGRFEKICVVQNSYELAELIQQAKNRGYHIPMNPRWEKQVRSIKRSSFTHSSQDNPLALQMRAMHQQQS
ncbi:CyaA/EF/ExoY family adenylyl cyclase toxin [Mycoavidus sp. B2-EB]|uniref:CyaA/EF/ExoY family adenylyl cyclase toxin n=1 Tax=Mycoavidus sp. B2-EB TaxID=2651972 RepID=UPI001E497285|nr:CyaA/EF/ExoY family adenylyl cyclase toxin [Mycoavidus sp. B2-EB]BBO59363.1 adenylate cyclase [Mycoavidus sp. B2-EB]